MAVLAKPRRRPETIETIISTASGRSIQLCIIAPKRILRRRRRFVPRAFFPDLSAQIDFDALTPLAGALVGQAGRRQIFHRQSQRFEYGNFGFRSAAGHAARDHFTEFGHDVAAREAALAQAQHNIARFLEGGSPRIHHHAGARHQRRIHFPLLGRHAPTETTCAPGATQASSTTGVAEVVASTTTSAPRTASAALRHTRTGAADSAANCRTWSGVGLQSRTSEKERHSVNAARWLRACTPEPRMASTAASARTMYFAETAETAAVRISVMRRPSIRAMSAPVSGSSSRMLARWVGKPRAWLAPITATSLAPSTAGSRTNPGMAAKRAASPISTTGRTGCTTWPDENAASVVSIAAINSGIGRTVRISPSLRHSVTGGTAQSSKRQIGRLTTCAVRPKWGRGPQCHLVFATSGMLRNLWQPLVCASAASALRSNNQAV